MKENGRPLPDALVTLRLFGSDDEDLRQRFTATTDAKGHYQFRRIPAADYKLSVSAQAHSLRDRRVSLSEGKTARLNLAAKPEDPYLNVYASQHVFTPDESPSIDITGFSPKFDFHLSAYRMDIDKLATKGGYQALRLLALPVVNAPSPPLGQKVLEKGTKEVERDAEGRFTKTLAIGNLPEGAYVIRCSNDKQTANVAILVSRIAIVTKSARNETLCYATDISSGKPIEGATLWIPEQPDNPKNSTLTQLGTTDRDGLASVSLKSQQQSEQLILARHGESMALVGLYRPNEAANAVMITAYCERPAYRPGDTVYFKGFVRQRTEKGYLLPPQTSVEVSVRDPDDHELLKQSLPVNAHGSFNGSFSTSSEGKPGNYNIICKSLGAESSGVYANVVAYRKPEFSIDVTPNKDHFTMGERASATVECKYYYGGPVVGAKVAAHIYRTPAFRTESDDEGGGGEVQSYGGVENYFSEDVEVVTDAAGKATIEFPTRAENDPQVFTNDYLYEVSADVSEADGKSFNGSGQVRVVRGDFDLSVTVENPILSKGEVAHLTVRTTDPVKSDLPAGDKTITVESGIERWDNGTSFFIAKSQFSVTTDAQGVGHLDVPVDRLESISLRATGVDSAQRKILAQGYVYVVGAAQSEFQQSGQLKITLDKRRYQKGDVAQALIQTDTPGGSALVCIQSDRILFHQVVPLTSNATLIKVPIEIEYAPNVFLAAAYVTDKKFLEASQRLRVDREDRKLRIEVKSDKEDYLPGAAVQLSVRTTNSEGKPVPAEVSVGVVDQGIYDIRPDSTDIYSELYPERYDQVQTNYSFPEIYLDGGDKGTSKIPLRTKFRDTAAWVPAVWTGATGMAEVTVTLPDNLTGWRATAIGLSDESQAGMSTTTFRARKPLMVRLGLPQFLVAGDQMTLSAVVTNDTTADANVNLLLNTENLTREGDGNKNLSVNVGQPQSQLFSVTALEPGTASVTAQAQTADHSASDGVKQSIPIIAHGRPTLETQAGDGATTFTLKNGPSLDPKYGGLTIRLEPTLAGNLVASLDGLIDFPYGCVEQTMSRFLPSLLVERAVKDLGLSSPPKLANLPKIAADSLARLDRMRHYDGGWGWWEYDETDPFMTALVLDGLDRARSTGYDVSVAKPENAANWGMGFLKSKNTASDRDKLYVIYSLLRWNKPSAAQFLQKINLKDRVKKIGKEKINLPSSTTLALGALAYHEAKREAEAQKLLDRLLKLADRGIQTATWSDEEQSWGSEPTALALVALEALRPNDPIIPNVVRSLMRQRQGQEWSSTRDTAYSLIGLTAYLKHTHELDALSTATVTVAGRKLPSITLDPKVFTDPRREIIIPREDLPTGPIQVQINRSGGGHIYYTVELKGLEVSPTLQAKSTDPGLKIERAYYRMEPRQMENGEQKLLPSLKPLTQFRSGDLVRVVLTIRSEVAHEFVLVEEPTPSDCRVTEREELADGEEWSWWWSRTVIMDDHLAFFARRIPKGESKITYNMRAEQVGTSSALPSTVRNMYDPGRWASSAETKIEVSK